MIACHCLTADQEAGETTKILGYLKDDISLFPLLSFRQLYSFYLLIEIKETQEDRYFTVNCISSSNYKIKQNLCLTISYNSSKK